MASLAKRPGSLTIAAILILTAGCAPQPEPAAAAPRDGILLKGAGATFPSLLYKLWFESYQHDHPRTAISYDAVGSGEGVRRFIGANITEPERVDFGASDVAMTDEQIAQVPGGVLLLPLTGGCVTLSYNIPGLQGDLRLSRQAYAGIFLGTIRNWSDPLVAGSNPGATLPDLSIVTVVRQDASGTTYAFTKHLDAVNETWRNQYGAANVVNWPGNAMRAEGNEGVAGRIQHSEGSIGYIGYEFAHRLGLRMALLENKSGAFLKPGEQSCGAALTAAEMSENLRVSVSDPAGSAAYPIVQLGSSAQKLSSRNGVCPPRSVRLVPGRWTAVRSGPRICPIAGRGDLKSFGGARGKRALNYY